MVFKKDNEIIVTCNCGCEEGFYIKKNDNLIWISSISSNFYTNQNDLKYIMKEKYSKLKKLYHNKNIYVGEIILKEKELKELLILLKALALDFSEVNSEDLVSNSFSDLIEAKPEDKVLASEPKSKLHITSIPSDFSEEKEYSLEFKTSINVSDVLKNKEYQSYDSIFTIKEILTFIKNAEKFIEKTGGK